MPLFMTTRPSTSAASLLLPLESFGFGCSVVRIVAELGVARVVDALVRLLATALALALVFLFAVAFFGVLLVWPAESPPLFWLLSFRFLGRPFWLLLPLDSAAAAWLMSELLLFGETLLLFVGGEMSGVGGMLLMYMYPLGVPDDMLLFVEFISYEAPTPLKCSINCCCWCWWWWWIPWPFIWWPMAPPWFM